MSDCTYVGDEKGEKCLELIIRNCKGNINRAPFTLIITQGKNVKYCPTHAIMEYIEELKVNSTGPLFQFLDGTAISRQHFCGQLQLCLQAIGKDTKYFKSHSFRIGAATTAAMNGVGERRAKAAGGQRRPSMIFSQL